MGIRNAGLGLGLSEQDDDGGRMGPKVEQSGRLEVEERLRFVYDEFK